MFPSNSKVCISCGGDCDSKCLGYLRICHSLRMHLLYFCNRLIVQFRSSVFCSCEAWPSTFLNAIRHVVFVGPKKKMARVTARGIITAVTHQHPIWNCSKRKAPRHSVSKNVLLFKYKNTIRLCVRRMRPRPALVVSATANMHPELVWHRNPPLNPPHFPSPRHNIAAPRLCASFSRFTTHTSNQCRRVVNVVHPLSIGQPLAHSNQNI